MGETQFFKDNSVLPRKPLQYDPPLHRFVCVVYMDEDLLVLSKPAGLLSVPGRDPVHRDCLESRAKAAFPEALLVHRLDMATSGIMVMARTKKAQSHLGKHFERRLIDKTYIARVWGHVEEESGEVDLPLCVDWPRRPMQKVDYEHGRASQTFWRVLEREDRAGVQTTRVELRPHTGRAHQLRVHMRELGHPIVGDRLYASDEARAAADRMQLHAQSITFHHPSRGDRVTFIDPCAF